MASEIWSVVAVVSFWCWVVTVLLFIFKTFPRLGVFQSRPALLWGLVSVGCACIWMIALQNA